MLMLIFIILTVVSAFAAIAARVLLALAINFDCRARNLKATSLFTVLTFFFPLIVGIVYAGCRDGAEPNEKYCAACNLRFDGAAKMCPSCNSFSLMPVLKPNAKELAQKGVTLCVIGIVVFALSVGTAVARTVVAVKAGLDIAENVDEEKIEKWADKFIDEYLDDETTTATADKEETEEDTTDEPDTDIESILGNLTFYDRNGKGYKDLTEVPFYDKDGGVYFYQKDKDFNQYFIKKDTDKKLEFTKCFVDSDGYFVYDEKGEITMENVVTGVDKDGNKYVPASLAIWNEKGELETVFE